ncbi:hypothetical protein ACLOJK_034950 [Asimina triloba]
MTGQADIAVVMGGLDLSIQQPAVVVDKEDGNGANSAAIGVSSSTTEEVSPSSLATVVDAMLRPHRILDELDVVDMMNGIDILMEVHH